MPFFSFFALHHCVFQRVESSVDDEPPSIGLMTSDEPLGFSNSTLSVNSPIPVSAGDLRVRDEVHGITEPHDNSVQLDDDVCTSELFPSTGCHETALYSKGKRVATAEIIRVVTIQAEASKG